MKGILRRELRIVAFLLLLAIGLTGCWDSRPIERMAIVLTMAFDVGDEPDTYTVIFEVINVNAMGGSGQEGSSIPQESFLLTGTGRTILEAMQNAQRKAPLRLFLSQLQNVIIGEELARAGLAPTLDHLQRSGRLRRTVSILIARGSAKEVLAARSQLITVRGLAIEALGLQAERLGLYDMIFGDFLEAIHSPGLAPTALAIEADTQSGNFELVGIAGFHGDQLVGFFDMKEGLGLALARGLAGRETVLVAEGRNDGESFFAALAIQHLTAQLIPQVADDKVKATIRVRVQSILYELTAGGNLTSTRGYDRLEKLQEETVKQAIQAVIDKAQQWRIDVFGVGNELEKRFPQAWRKLEDKWPEAFADVEFTIEVNSRIAETGLTRGSVQSPQRIHP